jgi:DNA glycosylase AlkZ-like
MRSAAQLLHRPTDARDPADIARRVGGIQAQDPRAGRLGLRVRSRTLRAADVDRARTDERSILRTWAMRNTMHLIASEDAPWLLPLFESGLVAESRRRLGQLGLDPPAQARALEAMRRALTNDGYLGRTELVERLQPLGIEIDAPRRVHLFRLAVAEGVACLGPDRDSETMLALAREWLGERAAQDREGSLAELARRYLRAFGPATEVDFAGWAGLGLTDVRSALSRIGPEIAETRIGGARAWTLRRAARPPRGRIVRLLPAFDNYLMGHRDRDFIAQPVGWRRIMPGGGLLRPAILVDGVAVGTWSMRRGGGALEVALEPFAELGAETMAAIHAEVTDIGRFEGTRAELVP